MRRKMKNTLLAKDKLKQNEANPMQDNQEFFLRRIRRVHLVGIGGAGMGGIAEVLFNLGYAVTGSDPSENSMVLRLKKMGIAIAKSHSAENVKDTDAVVVSTAIARDNVELQAARERRIPIVPRAVMLAELMRFKQGIAVAGTHGKTTTTSLVASLFAEAGMDPTFVIGGRLNSLGTNAKLGTGQFFIAEADESDASFLHLNPMISIVTNIDRDHLETYQNDFSVLKKTYLQFLHRLPFYGLAVLCLDDPEIRSIIHEIERPILTYGFSEQADYRAINFKQHIKESQFEVLRPNKPPLNIVLNLPGKHNVLNALAAIAVATEESISDEIIQKALQNFQGVGRRFQVLGEFKPHNKRVLMIDDYGHHPREIQVVLDATRAAWPERRLVMVYQPHRYTRTKALFEDFVSVLSQVDTLILLDIYSAGETPIAGADGRSLSFSIRSRGKIDPVFVPDKSNILTVLHQVLHDNDVLLMQGAGDIGTMAADLAKKALSDTQS